MLHYEQNSSILDYSTSLRYAEQLHPEVGAMMTLHKHSILFVENVMLNNKVFVLSVVWDRPGFAHGSIALLGLL